MTLSRANLQSYYKALYVLVKVLITLGLIVLDFICVSRFTENLVHIKETHTLTLTFGS